MRKMLLSLSAVLLTLTTIAQTNITDQPKMETSFVIAEGNMPARPVESAGRITIVYGSGDSLMQVSGASANKMGSPKLVAVTPGMFSFAMRGPQAVSTSKGIVVTICTKDGDIFCFREDPKHRWEKSAQLNTPGSAKEGLMSLAAEGDHLVAVWLNVREPKGQTIYEGISNDAGRTWTNREIYSSPDGTTCECCKPSVMINDKVVYVMFRNWINGNRDMHIMKSEDGGLTFSDAQQLGTGNWKLNGCPMDGGDLQINNDRQAVTIWRREGKLFTSVGTGNETFLAEGKNGSVQATGGGNAYAWVEKGIVKVQTIDGQQHLLGEGSGPKLTQLKDGSLLCTWQKEKVIQGWRHDKTAETATLNR
jgi:hypothetical protein